MLPRARVRGPRPGISGWPRASARGAVISCGHAGADSLPLGLRPVYFISTYGIHVVFQR